MWKVFDFDVRKTFMYRRSLLFVAAHVENSPALPSSTINAFYDATKESRNEDITLWRYSKCFLLNMGMLRKLLHWELLPAMQDGTLLDETQAFYYN